jgi:UDP-N-acetylglucosamine:LPS N-acetylglucosamine transferase
MTLMQDKLNRESLTAKLKELLSRKEQFKQALKNCPLSDGTQNVLNLIKDIQKK